MANKAVVGQRHRLQAPVQGVIASLSVGVGDAVVAGQVLLLQEAMKMEVPLQAPVAGCISALHAAVGEVVDEGALLVELMELAAVDSALAPASASASASHPHPQSTSPSPTPSPTHAAASAQPSVRPELQRFLQRSALTQDAARPEAAARRHASGLRMARENIADLLDAGSLHEYGALAIAAQRSRRSLEDLQQNTPADGLITGTGLVAGRAVAVMAYDYTVLAGTQGVFNHQKADRLLALCQRQRLPLVLFAEGGGGRPGDVDWLGVAGLDCTTFSRLAGLSGQVPLVGVVAGRCFAGNAALLGCCDLIIAVEGASIGMGGPAMIEGGGLGKVEADAVGPVDTLARVGVIDVRAPDEAAAVALARRYVGLTDGKVHAVDACTATTADGVADRAEHTSAGTAEATGVSASASTTASSSSSSSSSSSAAAAAAAAQFLREAMPPSRNALYEPRRIIEAVLDPGSMIELKREHGTGLITALARLAGRAVAVAASNPQHLGGALDAPACDKLARFMQLADAHGLPLVTFVDTPGFMVGPQSEATAMVRHAARLFLNAAALRVPVASVVLRRGYGLGAMALTAGHFHAPVATCAWPTGEFGGMGLEGAVRLGFRKELEAAAPGEREALFQRLLAQAVAKGEALNMASHLEIDAVIDPADTRDWLVRVLATACAAPLSPRRAIIDAW
jgi:acetyl-CoA carboxylase carboxyltransferase component